MSKLLLVIDVTNGLTHPQSPGNFFKENPSEGVELIHAINQTITEFRRHDLPVVFVHVGFADNYEDCPKNSPMFTMLKSFQALKLSGMDTQFNAQLDKRDEDRVLVKKGISAFCGTELAKLIDDLDVDEIVLTGLSTSLAIHATTCELHDKGISATVISDACAAENKAIHQTLLAVLGAGVCKVETSADYCKSLSEDLTRAFSL